METVWGQSASISGTISSQATISTRLFLFLRLLPPVVSDLAIGDHKNSILGTLYIGNDGRIVNLVNKSHSVGQHSNRPLFPLCPTGRK